MSGGDVETAVEIFMSSQDAGGGAAPMMGVEETSAAPAETSSAPEWWTVIWPSVETPPEAWRDQRLDSSGVDWAGGISQPKNGPCGVLAVVHGLILADQYQKDVKDIKVTSEAVAKAITSILLKCRPEEGAPVKLVRPKQKGSYGPDAELEEVEIADASAVAAEVSARISDFQGPGGIIDLVYSAVFTRGFKLVNKDAVSEGGELPLVPRAFNCWLCSMELMSLLMRGHANGNVGAFTAAAERNTAWEGQTPIGILSRKEKETGIPMADALKSPSVPVWILHGGDHFTVAWSQCAPSTDVGAKFKLHFWNGLPPGGPRLAEMDVTATCGTSAAVTKEVPKFYKPEPGEIDEVVQADPQDKQDHPGQYRKWRYEVMLAWDRPDLQGEPRPADVAPEPKFEQEDPRYQRSGPWRCRLCYDRRFTTMDFSLVPDDSPDFCAKCNKSRKECGWSLWVPFDDLPPKRQATVMDQHAKKIEPIFWTKWPAAVILDASGQSLPDC
eukprot:TRINITY_DN30782_c0_g1_i2.p1 TRINITY_DN30782_c0_g1~~TRINITY_DN30782_c0_g1_i2.p1  ORF type:complete len:556 (-),score=132.77 TRINITY_DN30782_c0_g1_i2:31-1524(-)